MFIRKQQHSRVQHSTTPANWQKQQSKLVFISTSLLCASVTYLPHYLNAAPVCTAHTPGAPCTALPDAGTAARRSQPQTLLANLVDSTSGNVFFRQTDYKHSQSHLTYIRYYNSLLAGQQGAGGNGWQDTYSVTLNKLSSHTLLLRQADGRQSVFRQENNEAVFHADWSDEGTIRQAGRYWKWTTEQGNSVLFLGSFPVRYEFADKGSLDLFYKDRQLKKVTDRMGNRIEFNYGIHNPERLRSITLPDQTTLDYNYSDGQLTEVSSVDRTVHQYDYSDIDATRFLSKIIDHDQARQRVLHYSKDAKPDELVDSEGDKTLSFTWPGTSPESDHNAGITSISSGINSVNLPLATTSQRSISTPRDRHILRSLLLRDSGHCANNSAGGGNTNSLLTAVDTEEEREQQQCDQENSGPPVDRSPTIPGALYREVFAAGCLSYFDVYAGTGRGFRIEEAFMQHEDYANAQVTATRFPVLDFLDNRVAVAIVSRDLRSPSYSGAANESALYYKLLADAAHMHESFLQAINDNQEVSATQDGLTTTVNDSDFDTFVFELVVQMGTATPAHIAQIQRAAAEIFRLYGIRLQVVEIP